MMYSRTHHSKIMLSGLLILLSPIMLNTSARAEHGDMHQDIIIVLDNSGSMQKNDPEFLTSQAVADFIKDADTHADLGIIVFDQAVKIAVPLINATETNKTRLIDSLKLIDYKGLYTNSPAAIERAIYELKNNARDDSRKYIIFLTDGIVDTGDARADIDKSRWLRQELAADAKDNAIKIFAVALTEDADFQLIQSLAQRTGADYFRALEASDLAQAFDKMRQRIAADLPAQEPDNAISPSESLVSETAEPDPVSEPVVSEDDISPAQSTTPAVVLPELVDPVQETPSADTEFPPSEEYAAVSPLATNTPPLSADETAPTRQGPSNTLSSILLLSFLFLIAGICYLLFIRHRFNRKGDEYYIPKAFLLDVHSHTSDKSYELGQIPTMIGRVEKYTENDLNYIAIKQTTIGRRHALIEYRDFSFWVTDQGSTNGTYVNDRLIDQPARLKDGDRVRFHKFEFVFEVPDLKEDGMTEVSSTLLKQAVADRVKELPEPQFDLGVNSKVDLDLSGDGPAASRDESADRSFDSEDETILPEHVDTIPPEDRTDENLLASDSDKKTD